MPILDEKSLYVQNIPNKNQDVILSRTLSTCRHLYNEALAEWKRQAELNRLKKQFDVFPWGKTEWIYYKDQANNGKIKTKTGIDVGLIDLITLSNGEQVKPPKFLRESEKRFCS